jgi:hypothetical protein
MPTTFLGHSCRFQQPIYFTYAMNRAQARQLRRGNRTHSPLASAVCAIIPWRSTKRPLVRYQTAFLVQWYTVDQANLFHGR